MTKTIKLNSSNIINIRKKIDAKKKKYWNIIRSENLMSAKQAKSNECSGLDAKALYNEIIQLSEKLVYIKGMLFYLNMGVKTFDKKAFKSTNNYSIFMACEMKEAICQLKMVPTLNPATKAKKGGAKKMGKIEQMSSAKIASLIKDLQLKANKFDANLEEFNQKTEIDISNCDEDFKSFLTA